jgi:hypothetical protein
MVLFVSQKKGDSHSSDRASSKIAKGSNKHKRKGKEIAEEPVAKLSKHTNAPGGREVGPAFSPRTIVNDEWQVSLFGVVTVYFRVLASVCG